jgi:hypothetical protein
MISDIETRDGLSSPGSQETNSLIEQAEGRLLDAPQLEMPLTHRFAPGVYLREILMPAGAIVIGQQHKTEHFNIVISGKLNVMINGVVEHLVAPCIFKSGVDVRKVLYIIEDTRWITVHPTDETDLVKLEELLILKSPTFLRHQQMMAGQLHKSIDP